MELIGLILGLVALAVGLYHVVEIRRALSNLAVVQSSISTQYLGQFPKFMDDIITLVESANRALVVFCDFPGYGEFSNPPKALEYQQALERKRQRGLKLDVTCLDAKSRRRYLADQFPAAHWRDWARDPETRGAVTRFLEAHPDRPEAEAVTYDRLLEMLHEADQKLLDEPYLNTARQIALHSRRFAPPSLRSGPSGDRPPLCGYGAAMPESDAFRQVAGSTRITVRATITYTSAVAVQI